MTLNYLAKSVTQSTTGIVCQVWFISSINIQNNTDPSKINISVSLAGYVSPASLSGNLQPVPGVQRMYRLSAANFPAGIDLTSITQAQLYSAILQYISTNTNDALYGATLASI